MATKTIGALTTVTSALGSDLIPIWIAASNVTRKITKTNFIGAAFTGAGTIATGGFTLTMTGNSTINGSLVGNMTGGGTLITTGGFDLTVPATGTAALLGTAQTFTANKTFTGEVATNPAATGDDGIVANMPASTTAYAWHGYYNADERAQIALWANANVHALLSADLGNNREASVLFLGRNTNAGAAGPTAAALRMTRADNSFGYIWVNDSGNLMIHTNTITGSTGSATRNGEALGTVVGAQTSWHESKKVLGEVTDRAAALERICALPIYEFEYNEGHTRADGTPDVFTGPVGYSKEDWFLMHRGLDNPSLNPVNMFGQLVLAIQAQQEQIDALRAG